MNRFNFRPILVITISLVLGILTGIISGYYGYKILISLSVVYTLIFGVLFIIRRKLKWRAVIVYLLAFITFISSSVFVFLNSNKSLNKDLKEYNDVVISGTITEIKNLTRTAGLEDEYSVVIKGKIDGEVGEYKIGVYFSTKDAVYTGSLVKLKCNLRKTSANNFNEYLSMIRNGLSYEAYYCNVLEISNPTDFVNVIKQKLQNNLITQVPTSAGVIYALITGDEYVMYQDDMLSFRKLGVSHIFAVSGLHVGFLFALISFILSIFKVKGKKSYIISSIILFLYVGFCGFSASSIRALVIILVSRFALYFSFKNDKLNTYMTALLIVLLVNPYNVVSYGAILSFLAYFGIVFISPTITKLFSKILPDKFALTISTYVTAFLITLPVVVDYVDGVSLFSSIFNFFIVPIIGIVYPFALIGSLLSFIIPLKIFLLVPHILVSGINYFISIIFIDHFYVKNIIFKSSKIFYYLLMIFLTDKINLTKNEKRFIIILLLTSFILSFIAVNINGDIFSKNMVNVCL